MVREVERVVFLVFLYFLGGNETVPLKLMSHNLFRYIPEVYDAIKYLILCTIVVFFASDCILPEKERK